MSSVVEKVDLSDQDRINLNWMRRCNAKGVGFLAPSVRRYGALPELKHLVRTDLAKCITFASHGDRCGYWILPAGRAALEDK